MVLLAFSLSPANPIIFNCTSVHSMFRQSTCFVVALATVALVMYHYYVCYFWHSVTVLCGSSQLPFVRPFTVYYYHIHMALRHSGVFSVASVDRLFQSRSLV